MVELIFSAVSAVAALAAAWLWWKASVVSVPAPPDTHGVGSLLGGYLISMVDGKRIDLHGTLSKQSLWNTRAATAAMIAALATGIAMSANIIGEL